MQILFEVVSLVEYLGDLRGDGRLASFFNTHREVTSQHYGGSQYLIAHSRLKGLGFARQHVLVNGDRACCYHTIHWYHLPSVNHYRIPYLHLFEGSFKFDAIDQ